MIITSSHIHSCVIPYIYIFLFSNQSNEEYKITFQKKKLKDSGNRGKVESANADFSGVVQALQ